MPTLQRPDIRVVVRILGVLCERGTRLRPTQLQQASQTSYTQFTRYLAGLESRGLVRVIADGGSERWIELTSKGFEAHSFLMRGIHSLATGPSYSRSGQ